MTPDKCKLPVLNGIPRWKLWILKNVLRLEILDTRNFKRSNATFIADCSIGVFVVDEKEIIKGRLIQRDGDPFFVTAAPVLWSEQDLQVIARNLAYYRGKL